MNDPNRPPIASPDGSVAPLPPVVAVRGDWATAPKIVRSWAYQLSWLGIVVTPLLAVGAFLNSPNLGAGLNSDQAFGQRIGQMTFYVMLLAFMIWLNRGLKSGARSAWTTQIVLSALGLLALPVGTVIHGYILSQWFKPETKAWFGQL